MSETSQAQPSQSLSEIKQAAEDDVRGCLSSLCDTEAPRPGNIQFFVLLEDGQLRLFTNRAPAKDWANEQKQAYAFGEFRSMDLVKLSDENAVERQSA